MLTYESLTDRLIRIRLEPGSTYCQSHGGKSIILNYYVPQSEMKVYLELTQGKESAFVETNRYRLPSGDWVYCKPPKKIEQCDGFEELEQHSKTGNVYQYKDKVKPSVSTLRLVQ